MNDRVQILVEENIKLVNFIIKKHRLDRYVGLFGIEKEDLFQMGCIALIKAAKSYDESKGAAFSTYAFKRIWGGIYNDVNRVYSYKKRVKCGKIEIVSYNNKVSLKNGEKEYSEIIGYEDAEYSYKETKIAINEIFNEQEKLIIGMRSEGRSQEYIANKLGLSQVTISRRIKKAGKKAEAAGLI